MLDAVAILQLLGRLGGREGSLSLDELSEEAGWSAGHLHRAFHRVTGETPLQYQRRLRLELAAGALRHSERSVAEIAEAAGFRSHPGFTRAFVARFGHAPSEHRRRHRARGPSRAQVAAVGPCIGLFHLTTQRSPPMSSPVEVQTRPEQPILYMRRRVAPSEIAGALAECLPAVFLHCQQHGVAMAGPPFARYPEMGRGLVTIECGIPVAVPSPGTETILSGTLPGGTVAVATHVGVYETLGETHAQVERWLESSGQVASGAPWESYSTDPADHPDPADWRTEVCWPCRAD